MVNIKLKENYYTIGLMSGTSLDGLDIVAARFQYKEGEWSYAIEAFNCIAYDDIWRKRLLELPNESIVSYAKTNADFGKYLGEQVLQFVQQFNLSKKIDVIGSHGHTILHQPNEGYTLQIGSGADIAGLTRCKVVCDLRSGDIAVAGQGAPFVPIGERFLFKEINAFLNIGGITNIAFHQNENVIAYDVCPGNTPLNLLARELGADYDENGNLARQGELNKELLDQLNQFPFYNLTAPRSLHTDVIVREFMSIVRNSPISVKDKLNTICEHIAIQVGVSAKLYDSFTKDQSLLITGGGAKNDFLIERIKKHVDMDIQLPSLELIDYKEALIMAFFAVLRIREEVNCIQSVTGANRDVCGGALYLG